MASHYDYTVSQELAAKDVPFYGLLFALIRRADTDNLEKINAEWPEVVAEFKRRYYAPGGLIDDEQPVRRI